MEKRRSVYQTKQKHKKILKDNLYDVPKPQFDTGVCCVPF